MNFDPEKEGVLNNVETCWFKLTIEDIERRSKSGPTAPAIIEILPSRLDERNADLNNEIKSINAQIELNVTETKAKIEKLKRELNSTNATLENVKNKVDGLEKEIKDAEKSSSLKFEELEQKFNLKRKELLSELKYYEAKINYLNDFKKIQTALQDKYSNNNELMLVREANFLLAMEELEGKRRSDRDNLKEDAKKLLYQLSTEFSSEIDRSVEEPAKRILRETVVLKPFFQSVLVTIDKLKTSKDISGEKAECQELSFANCQLIAASFVGKALLKYVRWLKERTAKISEREGSLILGEVSEELKKDNDLKEALSVEIACIKVELYKHKLKMGFLERTCAEIAGNYTGIIQDLYKIKYNVYDVLKSFCDCPSAVERYVEEIKTLV